MHSYKLSHHLRCNRKRDTWAIIQSLINVLDWSFGRGLCGICVNISTISWYSTQELNRLGLSNYPSYPTMQDWRPADPCTSQMLHKSKWKCYCTHLNLLFALLMQVCCTADTVHIKNETLVNVILWKYLNYLVGTLFYLNIIIRV